MRQKRGELRLEEFRLAGSRMAGLGGGGGGGEGGRGRRSVEKRGSWRGWGDEEEVGFQAGELQRKEKRE